MFSECSECARKFILLLHLCFMFWNHVSFASPLPINIIQITYLFPLICLFVNVFLLYSYTHPKTNCIQINQISQVYVHDLHRSGDVMIIRAIASDLRKQLLHDTMGNSLFMTQ